MQSKLSWAQTPVRPEVIGTLEEPRLVEVSGAAFSNKKPSWFWVHNDGGHPADLYLLDGLGALQAEVRLIGVANRDWEDMASFQWQQQSFLLVADTGDNNQSRAISNLYLLREPNVQTGSKQRVQVDLRLQVRYSKGPRDCEAVAVDVKEGSILLLSKRDRMPQLYQLDLASVMSFIGHRRYAQVQAKYQASLTNLKAQFRLPLFGPLLGYFLSRPTAMDIHADSATAVILTYGHVFEFKKSVSGSWIEALQGQAKVHRVNQLPQPEAIALDRRGDHFYVMSESSQTPILRWQTSAR